MDASRRVPVAIVLAVAGCGLTAVEARSQAAASAGLPASAVMARGTGDGWYSRGGAVGPWWSGSGNVAGTPAADGGFWFGWPGLGFGGAQGASRSNGTVAPSVTSVPGAAGTISSSRLVPFVTGVVPVVGAGYPLGPTGPSPSLQWALPPRAAAAKPGSLIAPSPVPVTAGPRPSGAAARTRSRDYVAAGDRRLLTAEDGPQAARAALADYRSAASFARDEPDILIRQAILHEALGQRPAADRALLRATSIDARLGRPHESAAPGAGGFLAAPPRALPVVAVRGATILDEIAAGTNPEGGRPDALPRVIEWLRDSWSRRWTSTAGGLSADRVSP